MAGCSMVFQHQPMQPRMRLLSCLLKERSSILANFLLIQPEAWSTVYLFLPTPEKMLLGSENTWWAVKCDTIRTNSEVCRSNVCDSHEIFMKHLGNDQLWLLLMMMIIIMMIKKIYDDDIWWQLQTSVVSIPAVPLSGDERPPEQLAGVSAFHASWKCNLLAHVPPGLVFHATFMVVQMGSVVKCS